MSKISEYQKVRKDLGLSRSQACERLEGIEESRLFRIESGEMAARPDEVVIMAKAYNKPELCNYYCAKECEIGKRCGTPIIEVKDLEKNILSIIAGLNAIEKYSERLIEVAEDGEVDSSELNDFLEIQEKLNSLAIEIDRLKMWNQKRIDTIKASGK